MSRSLLKNFASLLGVLLAGLAGCGTAPTFTTNVVTAPYGAPVELRWSIPGAKTVQVSDVGALSGPDGTLQLQPSVGHHVFTLTAGTFHKSVSVDVTGGVRLTQGTDHGYLQGTTFEVEARTDTGAPASDDVDVTVTLPGVFEAPQALTLHCAAAQSPCEFSFPRHLPQSGDYRVETRLGDKPLAYTLQGRTGTLDLPKVAVQVGSSTGVTATWASVPGAAGYRARLHDFESGLDLGDVQTLQGTSASFASPASLGSRSLGVIVEALARMPSAAEPALATPPNVSRATGFLDQVPGAVWQLHGSSDYQGDTLTLHFPALGANESLALVTLNPTDQDDVTATLAVTGTADPLNLPTPAPSTGMLLGARAAPVDDEERWAELRQRGHDAVHAREAAKVRGFLAHPHPAPFPVFTRAAQAPASFARFCVAQGLSGSSVRKLAVLVKQSAHVAFYVDQDDLPDFAPYAPAIYDTLAARWENPIYPTDVANFGAESDVDQNGLLLVFFTHELGKGTARGIVLGYYSANDVAQPSDTSEGCSDTGSNGADIFYMNGLANLLHAKPASADPTTFAVDVYSDTLAHEFQHLINFNQHHLVYGGRVAEDTWINEGLSVTAEDMSGYGWHQYAGRRSGSRYLDRYANEPNTAAPLRFTTASLTHWEGDPIGNYEGSHSFFRYWADRRGDGSFKPLVDASSVGLDSLAELLEEPLERSMAEWTTALLFSNETFTPGPRFDFVGPAWTPLHRALYNDRNCAATPPFSGRYGYVRFVPLTAAAGATSTLRATGWNAFVTGTGSGGQATVTITGATHPSVVSVRFSGALPQGDWTPSCP